MHPAERNHSLADILTDQTRLPEPRPGLFPPGRYRWPSVPWPAAGHWSLPLPETLLLAARGRPLSASPHSLALILIPNSSATAVHRSARGPLDVRRGGGRP